MNHKFKLSARDVFLLHMAIEAATEFAFNDLSPEVRADFKSLHRRIPGPPGCGCKGCRPGVRACH